MPLPREHTYTIKDIYALPEGERAELINGQTYVEPDVTVICDKSKITEKGINGAPDIERTTLYRYEEDAAPMIAPFDQTLTVGIYGDFEINIAKLLKEAVIK